MVVTSLCFNQLITALFINMETSFILYFYFIVTLISLYYSVKIAHNISIIFLDWKCYTMFLLFYLFFVSFFGYYILFFIVLITTSLTFYLKGVVLCGDVTSTMMFGHYIIPLVAIQELSSWALSKHGFVFVKDKVLLSDLGSMNNDSIFVGKWFCIKMPNDISKMQGHLCLVDSSLTGISYTSSAKQFYLNGNCVTKIANGTELVDTYKYFSDEAYNNFYITGRIKDRIDVKLLTPQYITHPVDYSKYSTNICIIPVDKEKECAFTTHFGINGLKLCELISSEVDKNGIFSNKLEIITKYESLAETQPVKILELVSKPISCIDRDLVCNPGNGIDIYTKAVKSIVNKKCL